jgi:acyloxyacyl hydrolase
MRQRNRCNHRDYQNISVNGARSGAVESSIIKTIARNQTTDSPVIVFFSLTANDICVNYPGKYKK